MSHLVQLAGLLAHCDRGNSLLWNWVVCWFLGWALLGPCRCDWWNTVLFSMCCLALACGRLARGIYPLVRSRHCYSCLVVKIYGWGGTMHFWLWPHWRSLVIRLTELSNSNVATHHHIYYFWSFSATKCATFLALATYLNLFLRLFHSVFDQGWCCNFSFLL